MEQAPKCHFLDIRSTSVAARVAAQAVHSLFPNNPNYVIYSGLPKVHDTRMLPRKLEAHIVNLGSEVVNVVGAFGAAKMASLYTCDLIDLSADACLPIKC